MSTVPALGSLLPFIARQAAHADGSLSFLDPRFADLASWKRQARARIHELLHYAPPAVAPAAEVVERIDCGDHWREPIAFSTPPDIRVPAFLLVPKGLTKPAPAVVALHDHGG